MKKRKSEAKIYIERVCNKCFLYFKNISLCTNTDWHFLICLLIPKSGLFCVWAEKKLQSTGSHEIKFSLKIIQIIMHYVQQENSGSKFSKTMTQRIWMKTKSWKILNGGTQGCLGANMDLKLPRAKLLVMCLNPWFNSRRLD